MKSTRVVSLACVGLAAAAFAPVIGAQDLTARDRYYAAAAEDDPTWRGLRAILLLRRQTAPGEMNIRQVEENFEFQTGDTFRLRVQSNVDGYLYVFVRNSQSTVRMLHPSQNGGSNEMTAYESRTVPSMNESWFRFDDKAGIEHVYLVLSPKPIAALDRLRNDKAPMAGALDTLVATNKSTRTLVYTARGLDDSDEAGASYYVERKTAGRRFLLRRFDLIHGDHGNWK